MITIKSPTLAPLTPGLAETHVNMPPLPGERPLRQSRVDELMRFIEAGLFNTPEWVIATLNGTGKQFRADGHHTATALTSVPRNKFPSGGKVLIKNWGIDSLEEDASQLFLRIDDIDAVRNSAATMESLTCRYKDLHDIGPKFKVLAANGIVYHLKELNQRQKDPDRKMKIHKPKLRGLYLADKNYRIFIRWLHHWNALKNDKEEHRKALNGWLMHKPALMAEAMANYFAHSEAATIFWDYMLDDAGPKGHPTKELVSRFNEWRSRDKPPKPDKWQSAVNVAWKLFLQEYEKGKGRK